VSKKGRERRTPEKRIADKIERASVWADFRAWFSPDRPADVPEPIEVKE
jgi:hypothetical protein